MMYSATPKMMRCLPTTPQGVTSFPKETSRRKVHHLPARANIIPKRKASLSTCFLFGSPSWTRTNDPAVNSRMLYRLSYRGIYVLAPIYLPRQLPAKYFRRCMSLTSVFGMGTGGPSSQSAPTEKSTDFSIKQYILFYTQIFI